MKATIQGLGAVEGTPLEIAQLQKYMRQLEEKYSQQDELVRETLERVMPTEQASLDFEEHTPKKIEIDLEGEEPHKIRRPSPTVTLAFDSSLRRLKRTKKSHGYVGAELALSGKGRRGIPIELYKILENNDREFYRSYDSMKEAAIDINVNATAISKAITEARTFSNTEGQEFLATIIG